MSLRIAIIGYGSLIWDLENLTPHVAGGWQRGAGPALPVEFSRISPKRRMGLVLVIDDGLEHQCPTSVIASARTGLEAAAADLAARERCPVERVGLASRHDPAAIRSKSRDVAGQVQRWLVASRYDAAVWTDLDGNFADHTGSAFDHGRAGTYLRGLDQAALAEAWHYITLAPAETDTPFRRHLAADPWWRSLDFRHETEPSS